MKVSRVGCAHQKQELVVRHIVAILVAVLTFCQSPVFAEAKEIIAEGTYNMGDGETPTVAESRAMLQAKRTAVEEAGTYVESYSKTRNFQLTVDEIQVLASGIMEMEVLEKKRTVVGDGINFWIKIKARVSTDKMEEMAKRVKEKSVVEDYKKIQEAYDKSQKEIEELKRQLVGAKGEKDKKRVEAKIADDERLLQANEWFEKGNKYSLNERPVTLTPVDHDGPVLKGALIEGALIERDYDKAIEAYTRALTLNPNFARAYFNRGSLYFGQDKYDLAIDDYNISISLNHKDGDFYFARGIVYYFKNQFKTAIADFSAAIAINPKDAFAYYMRGSSYNILGDFRAAIPDFHKACDLGNEDGCKELRKALDKKR